MLGGIGLFSCLFPLTLLLLNAPDRREAWADLSPLLSLGVGGILGVGLLLQRKLTAKALATWRSIRIPNVSTP